MRTHKNILIAAILIALLGCSTLWAQEMVKSESDTKRQSYFSEDAELYQPEPIPEPDATVEPVVEASAGRLVIHDTRTGEETFLDLNVEDMPPEKEQWIPGSKRDEPQTLEDQFSLMNFSDLSWVLNPEDWPWRPTCKIYYTRHGIRYQASGALIDAYHVLCAGHSLHEGNGGVWSSDIVVVPAYNGGICPYGDANGVLKISWEGWTLFGDFDHDVGLIRLDRPIGALTGWYGYGWTNDMAFYQRAIFQNPGYPAEPPYTGEYMYTWSGTFDSREYPPLAIRRSCFGGQGGSAAWTNVSGSYNVFAVLSHRNNNRTYYPIITERKFSQIEKYIKERTPLKFDLMSLDVKVSPGIVRPSERFDSMSYVIYNHSSSSWIGTVGVNVYLSTNDFISTSDTLIDRHYVAINLRPKERVEVTVSDPPTIPWNIFSGDYWLGVMLDISDHDTSNNPSHGQDAAYIFAL
ncbi:MAG: hypothetical protein JXM79_00910 [Sedimentisphaerales bacterium]|nr:hypothetical protein [Sedimentisphaerales bacterium]